MNTELPQPALTIVVPVYNVLPYLEECLKSILVQSLRNIEIICVNDGSTDDSPQILRRIAADDQRVTVIDQNNQGLSAARNTGIAHAHAEWIAFVDSDDKLGWMGETSGTELKALMKYATDDVDAVVGNACFITENNRVLSNDWFVNRRLGVFEPTSETLRYCNVPAWGKLYRTSVIRDNQLSFPVGLRFEDNGFFPKYFALCRKFALTPMYFYSYYEHKNTIMAKTRAVKTVETGRNYLGIVRSNLEFFKERGLTDRFLPYLQQHSYELFQDALMLSPESSAKDLQGEFEEIISDVDFPTAGHAGLTELMSDASVRINEAKPKRTRFKLKQAKRFDGNLFNNFVDNLRGIVNPPKRTILSRVLNTAINFYAAKHRKQRIQRLPMDQKVEKIDQVFFSTQNFITTLKDVDVVSFDIFDTLLVRRIQKPIDVFRLIEACTGAKGFADARVLAERRARREVDAEDVTLEQIYARIPTRFRNFQEVELQTELKLLVRNPYAYDLYRAALAQGKRVVALSDMYLPSDFLRNVLNREGYGALEDVMVSNELNATKWTGRIYPKATKRIGAAPERILQVGDNEWSDYKWALKEGFKAHLIPQIADRLREDLAPYASTDGSVRSAIHNALILEYEDKDDPWEKYGYMLGGPVVLSFLFWIKERANLNQNDHLAFVGRDGWILHQIYSRFLNNNPDESSYVYLPRTISLLSTLKHNGASYYAEYILQKANLEGVPVKVAGSLADNLEEIRCHQEELESWAKPRKAALEEHFAKRISSKAKSVAFVDLTSMWLTAFAAGHEMLGERNPSNYAFWFFGDINVADLRAVPFEAAINPEDRVETVVINQGTLKDVNVVNILESLVSSPEERVIGLKNGEPIYGGSGAKAYYPSVVRGIERYVEKFLNLYGEDGSKLALSIPEAVDLMKNFAITMSSRDIAVLAQVTHSANIENKDDAKPLIS